VLAFGGLVVLLRRRRAEGLLFAALLLCFPVVYYVTFVIPRYRHPIEPEMVLLGVAVLSSLPATRAAGAARGHEGARAPED
jgi:hypothetical protein